VSVADAEALVPAAISGDWIDTPVTCHPTAPSSVLSTDGSSWAMAMTYEDPTGSYPSPVSSTPTAFTLLAGLSNQFVTVGTSMLPIAGYQFSLNAPSSVGASVTQAGVDCQRTRDVCFTPENRHRPRGWSCRLGATNRTFT
jgi:hypothetical protein